MFARIALALSLSAASLLPVAAQAKDTSPCPLLDNTVTAVKSHESSQRIGKNTISHVDGASLFLPAQPGLSAEWLQRSVEQHFAQMGSATMPDCPLPKGQLHVSVSSAGNGYWVTVRSEDRAQAKVVLERATALLHRGA